MCHHSTPLHHHPGSTAVSGATRPDLTVHAAAAPPCYEGALERLQQRPPHLTANFLHGAAQVPTGAIKRLFCGSQTWHYEP